MYYVKQMLQKKGTVVYSVSPDTSTIDALRLLAEKEVGALLVLDGDKLVGIISERDFVRQIAEQGNCSLESPVSQAMTSHVITIPPTYSIEECKSLMTTRRIRHLPVVEDEHVVGVISIGDVVKSSIENQEDTIHNLERYIRGDGRS
jgi:CBS domain-containing protein